MAPKFGSGNYPIITVPLETPKPLNHFISNTPQTSQIVPCCLLRQKVIKTPSMGPPTLANWIRPVIPVEIAGTPILPRTFDRSRVGVRDYSFLPFIPWSSLRIGSDSHHPGLTFWMADKAILGSFVLIEWQTGVGFDTDARLLGVNSNTVRSCILAIWMCAIHHLWWVLW
jgi:hypothetical protein